MVKSYITISKSFAPKDLSWILPLSSLEEKNGHLHCLLDEHPLPIFYNLQINFLPQSVSQCSFQRQERLQSWVSLNWTIGHQIAENQSCIVWNFLPQAVPKSGCQVYWTHSPIPPNSSRWECCQYWSRGLWYDDDIFIIIISFSSPVCSSFFFLFPLLSLWICSIVALGSFRMRTKLVKGCVILEVKIQVGLFYLVCWL